jgi:hypothetical protein
MFFDILAVFVVSIASSLLLCTTSLHGLPPPTPSTLHYIPSRSSADLPSSLRHLRHYSLSSVDDDVGGDDSEMLIGESNESSLPRLSTTSDDDDDDDSSSSSSPSFSSSSSTDTSNEPFDFYLHLLPTKSLSREVLSPRNRHHHHQQQQSDQRKRSSSSSAIASSPSAPNFNFNSAVAAAALADASQTNSVVNLSQLSESTRLSPSLKILVETNPFARAWLTVLLQKVMQEQPVPYNVPYIFKYGRRRKK